MTSNCSNVTTYRESRDRCDDLRGKGVPVSLRSCTDDPAEASEVEGLVDTRARASARTLIASSTLSASLILLKAAAASVSLPLRSSSTTSRRYVEDLSMFASFCLWACCLVTPWGASYTHVVR